MSLTTKRGLNIFGRFGNWLKGLLRKKPYSPICYPVPQTLARVVPGEGPFSTLGPPGTSDVFVTAADDIAGLNAQQLANCLGIRPSESFTVIEFPTPSRGFASPINRANPGFTGGGTTSGGAREFVIPNGPLPPHAVTRSVR